MQTRCLHNSCRRALQKTFDIPSSSSPKPRGFRPSSRRVSRRTYSTPTPTSPSTTSPSNPPPAPKQQKVDPFSLINPHLNVVRTSLLTLLASGHPAITEITKYYFLHPSKQVRPVIVLLLSLATNGLGGDWEKCLWEGREGGGSSLDRALTGQDGAGVDGDGRNGGEVLNDWNPYMGKDAWDSGTGLSLALGELGSDKKNMSCYASSATAALSSPSSSSSPSHSLSMPSSPSSTPILPTQLRLAQIVEMLHTASLLHDDVIDTSSLRRGHPSAPSAFGNKLSVLGGNFVLGRASQALARLGNEEVTGLIAGVISNLVEGEILQMRDVVLDAEGPRDQQKTAASAAPRTNDPDLDLSPSTVSRQSQSFQDAWNIYLHKTYLKTASLMAKGARSAVVLGGCKEGEPWKEIAYAYGRNLGIAFQLVDDVLDYESASATLGKPGGADLSLGLATGPALYAWEEFPQIGKLIGRKFKEKGDVEMARDLVLQSSGVQRTRALAQAYADKAKEVLREIPDSDAKRGLEALTERVIGRKS